MANRLNGRKRIENLAWLLDSSIRLPGLNFRIGLESVVGLIPGIGDLFGALVSSYILSEAARLGAPRSVLLKMTFNVALDALVGAIPFFGDLFDLAWKANLRNLRLLNAYLDRPRPTAMASRLFVAGLILLLLLLIVSVVFLGALLVRSLWRTLAAW